MDMDIYFNGFLIAMSVIALIVFIALYFIKAGYGVFFSPKWGPSISNRWGWIIMEAPVFITMLVLWIMSDRTNDTVRLAMLLMFELHYFQRSFIFPLLFKGKSRMAISIMLCGVLFNTLNALMQGGWLFYISPSDYYTASWFTSPQFVIGTIVFFMGMGINLHSDHIIRHLRKPGDTKHYLPRGGMFRYVSSANYFGELLEWIGFAILTWSWAGLVFVWWTFANLAPRAHKIYNRYIDEFGEEFTREQRKRIIPFIY